MRRKAATFLILLALLIGGGCRIFLSSDYIAFESCSNECQSRYNTCFLSGIYQQQQEKKASLENTFILTLYCDTIYTDCQNKCAYVKTAD